MADMSTVPQDGSSGAGRSLSRRMQGGYWNETAVVERAQKALKDEVGIYAEWLHFYWAAHIHHALDVAAGVRPALEAGTDVGLARGVGNGRYCRANRSVAAWLPPAREGPVWGGMQTALCPRVGQVRCPFESHFCSAQALEGSAR